MDFNSKITPNIPKMVSSTISTIFSSLINDSYSHIALSTPIDEAELYDYEIIVSKNIKFLNTPEFAKGVYKDFRSFAIQKPEAGYYVEKNNVWSYVNYSIHIF